MILQILVGGNTNLGIEVINMKRNNDVKLSEELLNFVLQKNVRAIGTQINNENVNFLDEDKRTLLFHAILVGSNEIVQELLNKGALINIKDKDGWSPLHYAAQNYLTDIANRLIEFGADLEIKDNFGNTPLWRSVFSSQGQGEMIKLLLLNQADENNANNYGITPLKLANTIANYNIVQFFN